MSDQIKIGKGAVALAVDDDSLICRLTKAVLETAGYTVFTATSREQALKSLGVMKPKLILLDVELGSESGYDLCQFIRQTYPELNPLIIFVTSRKTADDVKKAIEVGGHYFVMKPFSPEGLLDAVAKGVIAKRRQAKQTSSPI